MVTIRNATWNDITTAIDRTSEKFDHNILPNRYEQKGKNFFVTLKVKDSHGKGARRGYPRRDNAKHMINRKGKAMVQACWHVYGTFFDELIAANDKIVIVALGKKISKGEGNWIDPEVGSIMVPLRYSEMCECEDFRHSYANTSEGA